MEVLYLNFMGNGFDVQVVASSNTVENWITFLHYPLIG